MPLLKYFTNSTFLNLRKKSLFRSIAANLFDPYIIYTVRHLYLLHNAKDYGSDCRAKLYFALCLNLHQENLSEQIMEPNDAVLYNFRYYFF